MSKSCNNCKYAVFQDQGYSNYTVEGTQFECRKNAHPAGDFDRWYGNDDRLNHGQQCSSYVEGEAIEMDVDGANIIDLTDEQRLIYKNK